MKINTHYQTLCFSGENCADENLNAHEETFLSVWRVNKKITLSQGIKEMKYCTTVWARNCKDDLFKIVLYLISNYYYRAASLLNIICFGGFIGKFYSQYINNYNIPESDLAIS